VTISAYPYPDDGLPPEVHTWCEACGKWELNAAGLRLRDERAREEEILAGLEGSPSRA